MKDNISSSRTDKKRNGTSVVVIAVLLIALIGSAVGFSYFGYKYIDGQFKLIQQDVEENLASVLNEIQSINTNNIKSMEESLNQMILEMEELKKVVSDADKSVTSTSAAQQSLTDKIQNLEKQLKDLQKGMELLRDAIR